MITWLITFKFYAVKIFSIVLTWQYRFLKSSIFVWIKKLIIDKRFYLNASKVDIEISSMNRRMAKKANNLKNDYSQWWKPQKRKQNKYLPFNFVFIFYCPLCNNYILISLFRICVQWTFFWEKNTLNSCISLKYLCMGGRKKEGRYEGGAFKLKYQFWYKEGCIRKGSS